MSLLNQYGEVIVTVPTGQILGVSAVGDGETDVFKSTSPSNQPERFTTETGIRNQVKFFGPYTYEVKFKITANGNEVNYSVSATGAVLFNGVINYPTGVQIDAALNGIAQQGLNLRVGDGYTPLGILTTLSNSAQLTSIAGLGDSLTGGSTANGNSPYFIFTRKYPGYYDCGNFGVSGDRSDQILARIDAVIASGARTVFTQWGANDIGQGVSETTLRETSIKIWNELRAAGIQIIDLGLPPTNVSENVPRYVQHNIWRTLYCAKNGIRHLEVWDLLATPAGAYASGMNIDNVHWNTVGAEIVADAMKTFVDGNVFTSPLLAYTDTKTDALTYLNNAVSFANTGGTPTGWFSTGTGGTLSVQSPDPNSFGSWARCTMTGGVNAGLIPTAVTLSSLGWSIGDTLMFGCKFRWVDTAQALMNTVYYSGITPSVQPLYQAKGGDTGASFCISSRASITSGTTIGNQFMASGTGYFEINRPICVNLTKLGLA